MIKIHKSNFYELKKSALIVPIYANGQLYNRIKNTFFAYYGPNNEEKYNELILNKKFNVGDIILLKSQRYVNNIKDFFYIVAKNNKQEVLNIDSVYNVYDNLLQRVKNENVKCVSLPRLNLDESFLNYPIESEWYIRLLLKHSGTIDINVFDEDDNFLNEIRKVIPNA
jgi:hypothetical protein